MMRQSLLSLAAMVSLLLGCAVVLLWARSYRHISLPGDADALDFTHSDPYWWVISNPGRLIFCHQVGGGWNSPTPRFRFLGLEFAGSWVGRSSLTNLLVPYWMVLLPFLILPAARIRATRKDRQRNRRIASGLCGSCGYDLRGSAGRCPECGASIPHSVSSLGA
jgi:hypothetical protein